MPKRSGWDTKSARRFRNENHRPAHRMFRLDTNPKHTEQLLFLPLSSPLMRTNREKQFPSNNRKNAAAGSSLTMKGNTVMKRKTMSMNWLKRPALTETG